MQGLLGFKIVWLMRSKVYRKWRDIMQEKIISMCTVQTNGNE